MGAKKHTAVHNGRTHTLTRTQWSVHLDITTARLEKMLIKHDGSLQQVIDIELADKNRHAALMRSFLMRPAL